MVHADEYDKDESWYMDGGATDHMTDRIDWFSTFKKVAEGRWRVMIADNRRLWIRGTGVIHIQCLIDGKWQKRKLERILFVPELQKNLFSVGQAADRGYVTTYTKRACYLASADGSVVMIGIRNTRLYRLELKVVLPVKLANIVEADRALVVQGDEDYAVKEQES